MPGDANWSTQVDSTLKRQAEEVLTNLLEAQIDRMNGYRGRDARDVLRDMERTVSEIKSNS